MTGPEHTASARPAGAAKSALEIRALIGVLLLGGTAFFASQFLVERWVDARPVSVTAKLHVFRSAIAQYQIHHDALPGQGGTEELIEQLLGATNAAGVVGEGPEFRYGPYMRAEHVPDNPLVMKNDVRVIDPMPGVPVGREAWIYDPATGDLRANTTGTTGMGRRWFDL